MHGPTAGAEEAVETTQCGRERASAERRGHSPSPVTGTRSNSVDQPYGVHVMEEVSIISVNHTRATLWANVPAYELVRMVRLYRWCVIVYQAGDCDNQALADEQSVLCMEVLSQWFR